MSSLFVWGCSLLHAGFRGASARGVTSSSYCAASAPFRFMLCADKSGRLDSACGERGFYRASEGAASVAARIAVGFRACVAQVARRRACGKDLSAGDVFQAATGRPRRFWRFVTASPCLARIRVYAGVCAAIGAALAPASAKSETLSSCACVCVSVFGRPCRGAAELRRWARAPRQRGDAHSTVRASSVQVKRCSYVQAVFSPVRHAMQCVTVLRAEARVPKASPNAQIAKTK